MQPVLETPRLVLRPFGLADAGQVQALAGDPRVSDTTTTIPHPYPDGAAEAWISAHPGLFAAGTGVFYAVTLREGGTLVGTVSLRDISARHARAELGYWTGTAFWGRGHGTEAVCRLIAFAHAQLGITRIVGRCFGRNPASARVMEKAGLRFEGRLPGHLIKNGHCEDLLLYGLNLPGRGP